MGLDGFLMKPRMATLGNEAALHGKSHSESADMPELNVKMFLSECYVSVLHITMLLFLHRLFLLSDLEEERLELLPPATGALRANHGGCPAPSKDSHIDTFCQETVK